ncbi:MAG: SDR family oxidoreductase, partial [Candidatus Limnocylindrus sp.]
MAILAGKRLVITGVLTDSSLAFGVAKLAQEQGASLVLTGAGRGLSITERTAKKLPSTPPVVEFDVTVPEHVDSARAAVQQQSLLYRKERARVRAAFRRRQMTGDAWERRVEALSGYPFWYNADTGEAQW